MESSVCKARGSGKQDHHSNGSYASQSIFRRWSREHTGRKPWLGPKLALISERELSPCLDTGQTEAKTLAYLWERSKQLWFRSPIHYSTTLEGKHVNPGKLSCKTVQLNIHWNRWPRWPKTFIIFFVCSFLFLYALKEHWSKSDLPVRMPTPTKAHTFFFVALNRTFSLQWTWQLECKPHEGKDQVHLVHHYIPRTQMPAQRQTQ